MVALNKKSFKIILTSLLLLGTLEACAGSGKELVPSPFLDEGGVAETSASSTVGKYLAGRQAFREKNTSAAANYFDDALSQNTDDDFLLKNAFQVALANGNMDRALVLARQINSSKSKNAGGAYLILAIDNIRSGEFEKADVFLKQTKPVGFNVLLKPVLEAWVQLGLGNNDGAYRSLDALDKYDGFKVLKSYHLALLAHVAGDTSLARAQYEDAMKGPAARAVRLVQSYGIFLLQQGEVAAARAVFEGYQKRFPLSPTIKKILIDLDENKKIAPLINDAISGAAEALYSSATIIGQEQLNGVASTYAYFSLMLKPDLAISYALLAEIAEDKKEWADALEFYSKVPATSPYNLNARIRSAWIEYKLGNTEKAVTSLEKLALDNPDNIESLVVLADLNRDLKDWEGSANAYGRAIDNIGDAKGRLWSLHYARGIAYERLNSWPKAEADLLQALKLQPNHPQVLNYLGYSWADRGENLDGAKGMLIKAVSLRPRDGYIVDSLGWLYYRLQDFKNATSQLERAVSLQPEDPTINDHLGDAYWRVQRFNEARYQWQRALWLEPEEKLIPIIQEKLENGLPELANTDK
ncbi:MAG: tetratricopeptide repeat protein [Sneathiella sp.]